MTKVRDALRVLQQRLSSYSESKRQILDVNQVNKLRNTLQHLKLFETPVLQTGDALPPCFHQVYFTPDLTEDALAGDGGDPTFNPPTFSRRMWAGGELCWSKDNALRVGEEVEEVTTFDRIEAKRTKTGEDMLVCWAEKVYRNDRGVALTDKRSWLFREPAEVDATTVPKVDERVAAFRSGPVGEALRDGVERLASYTTSEILLFRFSALTFNAHRIHYDGSHTRGAEGHPRLLVHAPLNILLLANMWRGAFGDAPHRLVYRAMSPCYVGLHNDVGLDRRSQSLSIERGGTVMMQARA